MAEKSRDCSCSEPSNLATNFQDLVTKVKNLVALVPVLGTISHLVLYNALNQSVFSLSDESDLVHNV